MADCTAMSTPAKIAAGRAMFTDDSEGRSG
jgi:hypothetical protein